jgi:acyl carrier protein
MTTIFNRVKRIIIDQLGVDEETVTPSASFAYDFNADSADLAEMVIEIEREFSTGKQPLTISDDEFTNDISTVQDLVDFISDRVIDDNS